MEYIHPKEEEPKFKCAECDKTFRIEAGYKLHMQNHEAEREALTNKYVCDGKINRNFDQVGKILLILN